MPWETKFFGRRFGKLELSASQEDAFDAGKYTETVNDVVTFADKQGYDIIDLHLNTSWFNLIPFFEDSGFRLVDTKLTFITLMNKADIQEIPNPAGEILFASDDMKNQLLDLTHKCFTHNPEFYSRFKNRFYYSTEDTERYYSAWIENHLGDGKSLFAVMIDANKLIGYLLYKNIGKLRQRELYKGVLVAVHPGYRRKRVHLSLQSFAYRHFLEDEFYLDTTTQITNIPTIRNYIKSKKALDRVEMIFYRRKDRDKY
jgi:ribosomal protein S18 acetylase RimI-like enzyme